MKTKEERNALKAEVAAPSKRLHELTEDEQKRVTGGTEEGASVCPRCDQTIPSGKSHRCARIIK